MPDEIDLRRALNAVSDVVQIRPRPLREFDQIYMKVGDMVMQSEFIARWADGKRLAFIGDGDAISVCVAHLHHEGIFGYGPAHVTVFDFDERICDAVTRFADQQNLPLDARLYNCLDVFPACDEYDVFYTNPPWGASNGGESVNVFMERGMEAIGFDGEGTVVVADDITLDWPGQVLANLQRRALDRGFYVSQMISQAHSYHLDDAPTLKSCNVLLRSVPSVVNPSARSEPITDPARLAHFYGQDASPRARYVRQRVRLEYGKANENEYELDLLEDTP